MNNKLDDGYPVTETEGKEWPEDNKVTRFSNITDPVRKALQVAMDKGDAVYEDGIKWTGLMQGKFTAAVAQAPTVALHAQNLTYSNKEQGRDVFTEIISIAVQLGIEQGRRMMVEKLDEYKFLFKAGPGKEIIESLIKG